MSEETQENIYNTHCIDKPLHALFTHFSGWLSPSAFLLAYADWLLHVTNSPKKGFEIRDQLIKNLLQFFSFLSQCCSQSPEPCIVKRTEDKRFENELWHEAPYNLYSQFFLLYENVWDVATRNIRGITKHHENLINFSFRQILDMFSPSNYAWLNPEVIQATYDQGGMNFVNGFNNWIEDLHRYYNKLPPVGSEHFQVGKNVAVTPGKVIYRNHLIELIQYEPMTSEVYAEPILIVPAWIMKYYILDLSENNSMVKFLVEQGHTVFMISWRNPTSKDRDLTMDDYVKLGVMNALNVVSHIIPEQKIHAVGYCIGGTLLMIAAAAMAKKEDHRLKSITLFAAQIDFKDAGELLLFIDESQLTYLEDIMWEQGYLDGQQMAGAFSMLRSIDLIWSRVILDYLLGERRPINDLMAWDYDTTRLPYKMHTEYLRKLFLNNELVEGHYKMDDMVLSLADINVPIFAVSTLRDHVAPWQSVYKLHYFTDTEVTFVLTNGGHNSGVVNEPGHPGRKFQLLTHKEHESHISTERWQNIAKHIDGSWWPSWQFWLSKYSESKISPPSLGNPSLGYNILCDAPGTYVFQK